VASVRKVDATENCPSRRKCIAIARLMSAGWDDSASYSVVGRSLSLNFYVSVERQPGARELQAVNLTLSKAFSYFARAEWTFCMPPPVASNDCLTGF